MKVTSPSPKAERQAHLAESVSLILKQLTEECTAVKLEVLAHMVAVAALQAEEGRGQGT